MCSLSGEDVLLPLPKKVLILVLSSGENETQECLVSIHSQVGVDFQVHRIIDLPNKEAHDTLYRKIEKESKNFDVFVKIDADMVFVADDTLLRMVRYFDERDLDHASFSVLDWYSQLSIMGMHMFSNRCTWPDLSDHLFVDPRPNFPGVSKLIWEKPSPVAYHSPNPSIAQAVQFGIHRGLKIAQRKRGAINFSSAVFHHDLMNQVYNMSLLSEDVRRKAALFGVEKAIISNRALFDHKGDGFATQAIKEYQNISEADLDDLLRSRWGSRYFGLNAVVKMTLVPVFFRYLVKKLTAKIKRFSMGNAE